MVSADSADKFTVVFRELYNDILIESYDAQYAYLEGIGLRAAALKAERLLPAVRVERVRRLLSCYKGGNCTHSFIENYGSKGRWKVSARSVYPVVTLEGFRLEDEPFGGITAPREGGAVAALKENGAEYAFISDSAEKLSALFGGSERLLRLLLPAIRKTSAGKDKLVRRKAKNGSVLTAKLSYYESSGLPFVHIDLNLSSTPMQELENSSVIAMAVTDHTGSDLSQMNHCMSALIRSGRLTPEELLGAYPFRSALTQGFARCGMTESRGFLLGAVPEYCSRGLKRIILFAINCDAPHMIDDSSFELLTPSESKVVRLATEGLSSKSIGAELNVSEGTVKRELFTSCKKLGVSSRVEMITKLYHIREQ